jgi:acetyl esterase/lipase
MTRITPAVSLLVCLFVTRPALPAEKPLVLDVWPGKVPGDNAATIGEEKFIDIQGAPGIKWLTNVTRPTLTVYRPDKDRDTDPAAGARAAALICPGGGYHNLAWDREGEEVAEWLNSLGMTGIILKYRCPRRPGDVKGEPPAGPLKDAQRAVSLVRSKAKEWGIDPRRIGMIGFSAGGHLVGSTATNFEHRTYEPIDDVDKASCRPDFGIMAYSGYFKVKDGLSPTVRTPATTPPLFFVHASDDPVSEVEHSVTFYLALRRAKIDAEMHLYATGGHGFGVRQDGGPCSAWTRSCADWLRKKGVLEARPHADTDTLRKIVQVAGTGKPEATRQQVQALLAALTDTQVHGEMEKLLPALEQAAARHARSRVLLDEIKRLHGKATVEVAAPDWLRSVTGDEALEVFGRIVEIDLNERTDGHKAPEPKPLSERVTDDWLEHVAGQEDLRRLEISGTAVTSAGLVHLKDLKNLEWLNVCLTAVDDEGLKHLAGLTKMRRLVVCSSKITGSGFAHLQGMKQLESINLHSSPAGDAGLEAIGKLTNLRRLEIVHTNVTDAGLKHLAGLVNLRELHIASHDTTEAGLPFVGRLQELYQLDVYERLASNQTLAQIGKLPKLRLLMLVGGSFDDEGVGHLAGLTTLEELWLGSDKVTDAAIEHLAGLKDLRKVYVGGTRITAAGKRRLQTLLPRVEILP